MRFENNKGTSKSLQVIFGCKMLHEDEMIYSKTCLKWSLKIDKTKILMTNGSLMQVESIEECSKWSILKYFWPALSDNWSLNQFLVFLRVAVLGRFYCMLTCVYELIQIFVGFEKLCITQV